MREEFEKLPFIKVRMEQYGVIYDTSINCYVAPLAYSSHADWIGGAWYAYQEQKKKIEEALKWLKVPHYGYAACISSISVAVKELEK